MASLFAALLSQQSSGLQTRSGLILTGLQHDFLSPDGKLPLLTTAFTDKIRRLVPAFREHGGDVIWVKSHFQENRNVQAIDEVGDNVVTLRDFERVPPAAAELGESRTNATTTATTKKKKRKKKRGPKAKKPNLATADDPDATTTTDPNAPSVPNATSDLNATNVPNAADPNAPPVPQANNASSDAAGTSDDDELFLTRTHRRPPCCVPSTRGAELATQVADLVHAQDLHFTKTYYSSFRDTSLLVTLRARLVTELYCGGNMTNVSVFATAMDAARHGIRIVLVEDCLGYRTRARHDAAVRILVDVMGAAVMTADDVVRHLQNPHDPAIDSDDSNGASDSDSDPDLAPPRPHRLPVRPRPVLAPAASAPGPSRPAALSPPRRRIRSAADVSQLARPGTEAAAAAEAAVEAAAEAAAAAAAAAEATAEAAVDADTAADAQPQATR